MSIWYLNMQTFSFQTLSYSTHFSGKISQDFAILCLTTYMLQPRLAVSGGAGVRRSVGCVRQLDGPTFREHHTNHTGKHAA